MQDFEYFGWWWLPSDEDSKVSGKLTFSQQDGILLDLIGSFSKEFDFGAETPKRYPIILGRTTKGQAVTLVNTTVKRQHFNTSGFTVQLIRVNYVLLGAHFPRSDDISFHKLTVNYKHLSEWAFLSGFDRRMTTIEGNFSKFDLSYVDREYVEFKSDNDTISIAYSLNMSSETTYEQEITLRQKVSFIVAAQENFDFSQMMQKYVQPLQNLLTFATGKPNSIQEIGAFSKDNVLTSGATTFTS